jgi:hypothetical protein
MLYIGAAVVIVTGLLVVAPAACDGDVIAVEPVWVDSPETLLGVDRPDGASARVPDRTAGAGCGTAAQARVTDGRPILVRLPPAPSFTVGSISRRSWSRPLVADPTWRLNFQGLMWMKPLARRAAQDGQVGSLAALVDQAVAFHRQNPDPKSSRYGWDEGTALRRLGTENCLYALTGAAALIPGMVADARVLLGRRYYGPPFAPVHNHGLMANLQLVRAADLIHRPAWKGTAIRRIIAEAPQAFSARGFTAEQASGYQLGNANLWDQAATVVAASPGAAAAVTRIRQTVARARTVFGWMTEPDRRLVQVGDTEEITGVAANPSGAPRVIRDDQTGWIVGRWSWTDPQTTYYTLRYGPPRRAHGHHDRAGGVTFSARGVRVLVGPGKYSYDTTDARYAYQISPQAQNVAIPDHRPAGTGAAGVSTGLVHSSAHAWTITDAVYRLPHWRDVEVSHLVGSMRVTDRFPNAYRWCQHWHLDPAWYLRSGGPNDHTLTFTHPSGRRLTVTTTGRVSHISRGTSRPLAGWHFPRFGEPVPAIEIRVRANATSTTTTFTIS